MKNDIINLCKDLMNFKTYKENDLEFNKLFNYIKDKFSNLYIYENEFNSNKILLLSNKATKDFDILFCCHIDVVDIDDWSIKTDKDNIYGRGSIDMKGQTASALYALNSYKKDKSIGVLLTSDEEVDGYSCMKMLELITTKLVIIPDGGKNFNFIKEEKGVLQLELKYNGIKAHASQPWNGINAIDEIYKVYQKLLKKYPLPVDETDYRSSINLSKIEGGSSYNTVCDSAKMYLDIRYTSETSKEEIIKIIKKLNKDIIINILFESDILKVDLKNKYIKKYIDVSEKVLNKKINLCGCESSSDAVYFDKLNIPVIIMNPIGDYLHNKDEYVNKDSLYMLYKIYKKYLEEVDIDE